MSIMEAKAKVEVLEEVLATLQGIEGGFPEKIKETILGILSDYRAEADMSDEEKVYAIADEIGLEVRSDYSGRGMYGEMCYGIVTDDPSEVFQCGLLVWCGWVRYRADWLDEGSPHAASA